MLAWNKGCLMSQAERKPPKVLNPEAVSTGFIPDPDNAGVGM
jgi:hypothetical protein